MEGAQRPEPLGAGPCFPEPCKGGRTVARGGGSAVRRGRNLGRRGLAALPWLSLPGAEAEGGRKPDRSLRPRQWHPFPGADLFSALLQGFRSPLRGSLHPWLCSGAPLRGLPCTGMPRIYLEAAFEPHSLAHDHSKSVFRITTYPPGEQSIEIKTTIDLFELVCRL